MNDLVVTAECATCTPWVRMFRNHATGIRVRQILHEDTCANFPRFSRADLGALSGD